MAIKFSGIIIVVSVICSFFTGKTDALTKAAIDGSMSGLTTAFSLMALMCLWCGIMKVAEMGGVLKLFSAILKPVLKHVFPNSYKENKGVNEISASISANILGMGNATTPLSLSAMRNMPKGKDGHASTDMKTFIMVSCAPICLFPTTVISLRAAAGSTFPSDILIPVWIVSSILFILSIALSKLMGNGK